MKDVLSLDALEQAELIRGREITAHELTAAVIAHIETLNPTLNLVVTPMFDIAESVARNELPDGPLAGAPMLLKDLTVCHAGVRHTEGSAFLSTYVDDHDSEFVTRVRRAGLIVVGKTNTPEFGNAYTTEPVLFGASRNPWDLSRTTGGSSGASAAAVAVGFAPLAHGNDAGGSIRVPASCCGVFGLKPTRGRNPLGRDHGDFGLQVEHALTRSVRDSAALLDLTSGPWIGDAYFAPPPKTSFLGEVKRSPGRLRIAFSTNGPEGTEMHPNCVEAVRDAAALCTALGHEVEEATPSFDFESVQRECFNLWTESNAWLVTYWSKRLGRQPSSTELEPLTWALRARGEQRSASEHLRSVEELQRATRSIACFLEKYDLWLTSVLGEPPVPIGHLHPPSTDPLAGGERDLRFAPLVSVANFTGFPAMSVPLFWNQDGLPIGSHFLARFGDEATLFRLAGQLEHARDWTKRRPPPLLAG